MIMWQLKALGTQPDVLLADLQHCHPQPSPQDSLVSFLPPDSCFINRRPGSVAMAVVTESSPLGQHPA